jgi:hypothetical protein
MSRKTLLVSAPLGLGALVLLWAAMAARGEPDAKPVRHVPKSVGVKRPASIESEPVIAAPGPYTVTPKRAEPVSAGGEYSVIEERIRKMEEKLLALETKKAEISVANQDLERQLVEKQSDATARTMADWRVRQWDQMLGLTETQKQSLTELGMKWAKEDAVRPPTRDSWLQREEDLRARLSAEQAARLHESAAKQSQQLWNMLGRSLGSMVGASKDEMTRFQQTLGDWRPDNSMLLPEGHGADWPGMMKEGTSRLQSLLTPEQMSKLNQSQRWIR